MSHEVAYSDEFFKKVDAEGQASARVVVPFLLRWQSIESVIDVGCGRGAWLSAFLEHGVTQVRGIDGPWVDPSRLLIPPDTFTATRLDNLPDARSSDSRFDLAICLEVAEHLPTNQSSKLIAYLTSHAPVVLFSAAIPGQQGTEHINEQWPEYWQSLFHEHGFTRLDPLRPRVWRDSRVAWYYQQNLYLFVSESALSQSTVWQEEDRLARSSPLTLMHPKVLRPQRNAKSAIRHLPTLLFKAIRRHFAADDSAGFTSAVAVENTKSNQTAATEEPLRGTPK